MKEGRLVGNSYVSSFFHFERKGGVDSWVSSIEREAHGSMELSERLKPSMLIIIYLFE